MVTKTKKATTKLPSVKAPAITKADIKKGVWNGEKIPTWTAAQIATEAGRVGTQKTTVRLALCLFFQKAGQKGCEVAKSTLYRAAEVVDAGKQGPAYGIMKAQVSQVYKILGLQGKHKPRGATKDGVIIDKAKIVAAIQVLTTGAKTAGFNMKQMAYFTAECALIQKAFEPIDAGKLKGMKRVVEGNKTSITFE